MTDAASFALYLACTLCGLVVIAAWLFRKSDAHIAVKLILPSLLLAAVLYGSHSFYGLLGRAVPATSDTMPETVHLIAFKAYDEAGLVDLWVEEGSGTRAYEIPLDPQTKKALKEAREKMDKGRPVILTRKKRHPEAGGRFQQLQEGPQDDNGFKIDLTPDLPLKE